MLRSRVVVRIALLLGFAALLLGAPVHSLAQSGDSSGVTDDQVNAIAKQLYCPVCENVPLDVCGTQACEQWRQLIRLKLSEGWSEAQIKQYFVDQYGDRVLATPPPRGLNWLVYVIPPVAIIAGIYVLFRAFMAWKRPTPAQSSAQTIQADEYVHRIEEELKKR